MAAATALSRLGADVLVSDSAGNREREGDLRARGWEVELGGHSDRVHRDRDLVVVSPGIPWDIPVLVAARNRGVEVMGEVELAWRLTDARFVAITGTNGKSTTTRLVTHLLEASGQSAVEGGNIGAPLCDVVPPVGDDRVVVSEISSYQLEGVSTFRPAVSAILNITPDHLERHGSFDSYVEAKARVFERADGEDRVVLGADDPVARSLADRLPTEQVILAGLDPISPDRAGAWVNGQGWIRWRRAPGAEAVPVSPSEPRPIPGPHNLANLLVGVAVAASVTGRVPEVSAAFETFRPLPHRHETVAVVDGVSYVNDSKATNVDAARMSILAYDRDVILVAGGRDKGSELSPLVDAVRGRVRTVLLVGEAAERMSVALDGICDLETAGTLEVAVARAHDLAHPGDVVLLAPACASFDQFDDFEHRGRCFRSLVVALEGESR